MEFSNILIKRREIGSLIMEKRVSIGLTRYRLSKLTGLQFTQIKLIEKGTVGMTIDTLFRILEVLNIEITINGKY